MKTKRVEHKVELDRLQIINIIQCKLHLLSDEELTVVFRMQQPECDLKLNLSTNKFHYNIYSDEILSWEEEVDIMSDSELTTHIKYLIANKTHLKLPVDNLDIADYLKQLLKDNK